MPQSLASPYFHFVFSTRNRRPLISKEIQQRLYSYIGGILRAQQSVLLAAGGMPDHIHLLVSLSRQLSVSAALREIKANSSRWANQTFALRRRLAWQAGYSAFSVSYSCAPRVIRYIQSQEEHHRRRTFKEELLWLLKVHQINFDEAHLWD